MRQVREILSAVEKGILLPAEGSRLIYEVVLSKMESFSQIGEVLQLCDEKTRTHIKQSLADLPVLECDWWHRVTLSSSGVAPILPEHKARQIALREHCLRNGIELPPPQNAEAPELALTPSEILEIDERPWAKNSLYDYVEKHVFGGPLALSPQVPSHGVVPKRNYSLDEMAGNPYLGRLWEKLLLFHPWERTTAAGSREPGTIMLAGVGKSFGSQNVLAVIRGGDSLAVLDTIFAESVKGGEEYNKSVCDRFESGASFALRGFNAEAVARALLLAKLSRQRLLAELKAK